MKKLLLVFGLVVCLATGSAKATQFWYDVITNYAGGCISTNSSGLWYAHPPGSITANDALVVTNTYTSGAAISGKRLRVNGLNSEYVMRLFDQATTNSVGGGSVYASFIANANFVPNAGQGTYFASFNDVATPSDGGAAATNGFNFRGRIYEIGNTNAWPNTNNVSLTYRFGLANALGDPAQTSPGPAMYVPIDAIKGVDYQVVLKYDIDNAVAYMWVNPASESDTANFCGPTSDLGAVANGLAGLLFRQRTGGGTMDIRDVVVGTTFADVVTNVASSSSVLVATNYNVVSTYAGNPALLEVFATSFGGGALSYQWYQISGGVTNPVGANSQKYLVPSVGGSDTGSYFCAVTNVGGQGALSVTNFQITVNTAPTPPGFTTKPGASVNGAVGGALTLSAVAFGTGPLSYQWAFNGNPLTDGAPVTGNPGDFSVVSGSKTPTLLINSLSTNETGNYTLTVTSGAGGLPYNTTNATSAVTVALPQAVSIAYLRSLEDPATWQVTNTTGLFTVTGVVTMYTNVVGSVNTSYYIQDATAGVDFFLTANTTFRPVMGDIITATGTLSMFNNVIELVANNPANPATSFANVGHTNVLPAPYVLNLALTNNPAFMETNIEGRLCMLTNVWFTAPVVSGTANYNTYVTNASGGLPFNVFFPAATDPDVANRTLSTQFAYTVTGVIAQFVSGSTYANRYELYVTRIGDVQTNPPPPVSLTFGTSGNNLVLKWAAVPYTIDTRGAYAYSVQSAANVTGPYLPLASGMAFNTTNGTYTVTNALLGTQQFYRVVSP
jgi:hypothetical protein